MKKKKKIRFYMLPCGIPMKNAMLKKKKKKKSLCIMYRFVVKFVKIIRVLL